MRLSCRTLWLLLASPIASAFVATTTTRTMNLPFGSTLFAAEKEPSVERMQELLKQEASDPMAMKSAAEQMKNLSTADLERMTKELNEMNPLQKQALKAMGMDPDVMKQTLGMMKENPGMVESAQKLMANMTPEELMDQSRLAQERMKNMTPEQMKAANDVVSSIPKEQLEEAVELMKKQQVDTTSVKPATEDTSCDPQILDKMFEVAQVMSAEKGGGTTGVTLAGFASLPVIQLLSGDREEDLSLSELKECWADGSLGATRVDRAGFERVWNEVQEYFEDEIVGEARKEAQKFVGAKKKIRGSSKETTNVGESLTSEQLNVVNERVKDMSDDDVNQVLEAMEKMDPVQEARLKAMGVDPKMMQKSAEMMKSNPMMRKAAQAMMKNMSPDQMSKMAQQAQQQMKNMSEEDLKRAMNQFNEQK